MDQKKIGSFLKKLRKEKELTQEQLAEQLNVSNRSVSRWETGNNLPDIGILVELAKFYNVDIQEIIDGEKKSEKDMNESFTETLEKVADYNAVEKDKILSKLRINSIVVAIAILAVAGMGFVMQHNGFGVLWQWLQIFFACVVLLLSIKSILYISLLKDQMHKNRDKKVKQINVAIVLILCCLLVYGSLITLLDSQYSLKSGISHYICVTYDDSQEKEYIGTLDGYKVYIEGLSKEDCYFQDIFANPILLVDAMREEKVSIDSLVEKSWKQEKFNNCKVYIFENYQIVIENKECTIKSLK